MYIYLYIYICIFIYIYICLHTHTYIGLLTLFRYECTYTYVYLYIHIHITYSYRSFITTHKIFDYVANHHVCTPPHTSIPCVDSVCVCVCVMSHTYVSHVTQFNESCQAFVCVLTHVWGGFG